MTSPPNPSRARLLWAALLGLSLFGVATPVLPWTHLRNYATNGKLIRVVTSNGFGTSPPPSGVLNLDVVRWHGIAGALLSLASAVGVAVFRRRLPLACGIAAVAGTAASGIAVMHLRQSMVFSGPMGSALNAQLRMSHGVGPYALFGVGMLLVVVSALLVGFRPADPPPSVD